MCCYPLWYAGELAIVCLLAGSCNLNLCNYMVTWLDEIHFYEVEIRNSRVLRDMYPSLTYEISTYIRLCADAMKDTKRVIRGNDDTYRL